MPGQCWDKIVLFILMLFAYPLVAQDDTLRTTDSTQYIINHSSTGILNYTNDSRSYLLNNLLRFNIARKRISLNTAGGWIYGEQQSGLTNNDYTAMADVSYLKSVQKIYYWGLITYDKSYSLKITNRMQTGLGIGYNMITRPTLYINLSDGILYERTDLYDPPAYSVMRNSFRLKYKIVIAKLITLDGINFYQQSLSTGEDYIIKCTNNLSFRIEKWLNFTISTTYNKLNISKSENFLCTVGFSFQKIYTHVRESE